MVEKGLGFNGNDKELLRKYEDLLQNWLDYTIHHIPNFLIYNDLEKTTPDRCDELFKLLETYKDVCRKLGLESNFYQQNLIRECDFHYRNYKTYLQNAAEISDYKNFLESKLKTNP